MYTPVHTHTCTHAQANFPPDLMMHACSCFSFDVLVRAILPCEFPLDNKCLPFLAFTILVSPVLSFSH